MHLQPLLHCVSGSAGAKGFNAVRVEDGRTTNALKAASCLLLLLGPAHVPFTGDTADLRVCNLSVRVPT